MVGLFWGLHEIGAVGDRRRAPVNGNEQLLAADLATGNTLEALEQVRPIGQSIGIDRLQQSRLIPVPEGVRARMGEIDGQAGLQILEGLILIDEGLEDRRRAVLSGEIADESGGVEALPGIEDGNALRARARRRQ